jgi:GNAT superfamily N-acetyltransferase
MTDPDDQDRPGTSSRPIRTELATGSRYLQLATTLLQRVRLASATGGIWEAADIQWWSRQERRTDQPGQLFWLDDSTEPAAAVIATDWGDSIQCDVLVLPGTPAADRAAVWQQAFLRVAALNLAAAEFPVRRDDATAIAQLRRAGWQPAGTDQVVASWLAAAGRPEVSALAPGYRLWSRAERPDRPHPMVLRNGAAVAERLQRCSLYRPELDLMVEAPDGEVAGYGLFWADPVTRVGLVEPMRTEEPHQRRGIARHILTTGLNLLAARGCDRLKVSNDIGLYLKAGFKRLDAATADVYRAGPS